MNAMHHQIILHVGHGKTGSSALQSSLALSQERLLELGIAYPRHDSFDDARAGRISSGNVEPENLTDIHRQAREDHPEVTRFLYSSEHFFPALLETPTLLDPLLDEGARIRMVLFIRNPVGHAMSLYVQAVKRRGATGSVDEALRKYHAPRRVLAFLKCAHDLGVDVEVLNYSNHRKALNAGFARTIGIDPADLAAPPIAHVNRSLTRAEIRLQRAFNATWGADSCTFISDPLCNELPDIKGEKPYISRQAYDDFTARLQEMVAQTNAVLPIDERYEFQSYDAFFGGQAEDMTGAFEFSPAQLDVLSRAISARIPVPAEPGEDDPADAPTTVGAPPQEAEQDGPV